MQVSAEMRWFWREQCPADLGGWFFRLLPKAGGGVPRHDEYVPQDCCELGVKKRGSKVGLEVKGLIGTLRSPEILAFGAPYAELWCKWRVNDFPVDKSKSVVIEKFRWIRKLDTSDRTVREIPLGADELPLDRGPLPRQGCNLTLTKLKIARVPDTWWTFCFESFGDLQSVRTNLEAATKHAKSMSIPLPDGAFLSYPAWLSEFER
jgi:hypothetical protein